MRRPWRLIDDLLAADVNVRVTDPEAMEHIRTIYGDNLTYCADRYDALAGADALAIVTDWDVYRQPDFSMMRVLMNEQVIFDGRNLLDPVVVSKNGYLYRGIGRTLTKPESAVDPCLTSSTAVTC